MFFKTAFLISLNYISLPKSSVNLGDTMFRKAYVSKYLKPFFDAKNLWSLWSHSPLDIKLLYEKLNLMLQIIS